jgi:Transglycosylase SLT domain
MQVAGAIRVGWVIGWVLVVPFTAVAAWDELIDQHCVSHGIPKEIVQAIIEVESAGHPFAIGVAIKGIPHSYFLDNAHDAALLLTEFLRVTANVGIGLMQINWGPWGDQLGVAPEDLLDVSVNIRMACQHILKPELDGPGALVERIGRYHSHSPNLRDAYGRKIITRILKMAGDEVAGGS